MNTTAQTGFLKYAIQYYWAFYIQLNLYFNYKLLFRNKIHQELHNVIYIRKSKKLIIMSIIFVLNYYEKFKKYLY